jgi:hypothetical protein
MTAHEMRIKELSQLVRAADYTIDSVAVAEAIIQRQAACRLLLGTAAAAPAGPESFTSDARGHAAHARRSRR